MKKYKPVTMAGTMTYDGFKDRIQKTKQLQKKYSTGLEIEFTSDLIIYQHTYEEVIYLL